MITRTLFILLCLISFSSFADSNKLNQTLIEKLIGVTGKYNAQDHSLKISMPRTDLNLNLNGVKISADMGLTSWVTFKKVKDNTVVMGDLVLTEDQVNPMLITILKNNLRVTALHNHFLWESPRVMFMHIEGEGQEKNLASAISIIFSTLTKTSQGQGDFPLALVDPANTSLNPGTIDKIMGIKGKMAEGLYKITIPNKSQMDVYPASNYLDSNSWVAFSGSETDGMVFGDLTTPEANLQKVVTALNHAEINVMAIHQEVTDEQRFVVLHYLGIGKTATLAHGVKNALDATVIAIPASVKTLTSHLKLFNNNKFCPANNPADQYMALVKS